MEDGRARWQSFYNIFLYLEVQSLALRERNFGKGGNKVTHWHAATMASAAPSQHTGKRKFGKGGNKVTHCKWLQWPQLHPHNIPVKGNLEKEAKRSLIASGYNGLSCTLTTNR
jgi:hypothetical protein